MELLTYTHDMLLLSNEKNYNLNTTADSPALQDA